jgi:hypothetical protein
VPHVPNRPLILYLTKKKAMVVYLGNMMSLKERVIYYSGKNTNYESRIYNGREALLCICMGYKTTSIVLVVLHYMTNFKTGSS